MINKILTITVFVMISCKPEGNIPFVPTTSLTYSRITLSHACYGQVLQYIYKSNKIKFSKQIGTSSIDIIENGEVVRSFNTNCISDVKHFAESPTREGSYILPEKKGKSKKDL